VEHFMKKMVLSLLVDNTSGVLSRVSGMFSRRGYNIDSLSVGVTENPRYSRMTVAVSGDDRILSQIKKTASEAGGCLRDYGTERWRVCMP
jgi:acetolactate synthase-1/3 small subunit